MKKILKIIKKNWITAWFLIAVLSLTVITAYAIYTRITIAKRVVSTQAGASSLFSSSHMNTGGMKTIEPITDNTHHASVPVYVYNYAYPKESVYRSDVTEYDLTATLGILDSSDNFTQLMDSSELSGLTYSITYNSTDTFTFSSADGTTHTFYGCSISGNGANFNLFTLVFDVSELGNNPKDYCMKIEADPYDPDLPKLTGYVKVRYSKPVSAGWSGELEALDSNKDYDGYNYYLEGNGKGKLKFRWNSNYVTINKDFLENPNNTFYYIDNGEYVKYTPNPNESQLPNDNGIVYLIIEVDSTKQNRYEVQFYKELTGDVYSNSDVQGYLPSTQPSDWDPATAS